MIITVSPIPSSAVRTYCAHSARSPLGRFRSRISGIRWQSDDGRDPYSLCWMLDFVIVRRLQRAAIARSGTGPLLARSMHKRHKSQEIEVISL
jgi:hypothetical protein